MLGSSNLIAKIDHYKIHTSLKTKIFGLIKLIKNLSNNYAIVKKTDIPLVIIHS